MRHARTSIGMVAVLGIGLAATLAPAAAHAAPTVEAGNAIVWGWNDDEWPVLDVPEAARTNLVQITSSGPGNEFFVARTASGEVVTWGSNGRGELNVPDEAKSGVTDIASMRSTVYAVKDGRILMWGEQLEAPPARSDVESISVGWLRGLATTADGSVIGWPHTGGRASRIGAEMVPAEVQDVDAISAGYEYSVALKDGRPLPWVSDKVLPVPAEVSSGVTYVSASVMPHHGIFAIKDGVLHSWGYAWEWPEGQKPYRVIDRHEVIPFDKPLVKALSTDGSVVLGLTAEGEVVRLRGTEDASLALEQVPPQAWSGVADFTTTGGAVLAIRSPLAVDVTPQLSLTCTARKFKTHTVQRCNGSSKSLPTGTPIRPMADFGPDDGFASLRETVPSVIATRADGSFSFKFLSHYGKPLYPTGTTFFVAYAFDDHRWYHVVTSDPVTVFARPPQARR